MKKLIIFFLCQGLFQIINGYTHIMDIYPPLTNAVLKKRNFPPRNMQNNFSLLMWDRFFLHQCIMIGVWHYISTFYNFCRNSGAVSGRKVSFFEHCKVIDWLHQVHIHYTHARKSVTHLKWVFSEGASNFPYRFTKIVIQNTFFHIIV